jgi:hypothetical protein
VPGLAVVIVGERKDSQTYVRMKRRACAEVDFRSFNCDLPGDSTQQEVLDAVAKFNANPAVHGILVQLPVRGPARCSAASSRAPDAAALPPLARQQGPGSCRQDALGLPPPAALPPLSRPPPPCRLKARPPPPCRPLRPTPAAQAHR